MAEAIDEGRLRVKRRRVDDLAIMTVLWFRFSPTAALIEATTTEPYDLAG